MNFAEILREEEQALEESSGAMFAVKSLMDKFKKTNSKTEREKMVKDEKGGFKSYESQLEKNPFWKTATIKKDYDKFKEENSEWFA